MFLVFLTLAIVLTIYGSKTFEFFWPDGNNKDVIYICLSILSIIVTWALFYWGKILKNYRSTITIDKNTIIQKDAILFTTKEYPLSDLYGYIELTDSNDVLMNKIIIYLKDGSSINFISSLIINFHELRSTLTLLEIKKIES